MASPSTHESNRRAVVLAGHATPANLAGSPVAIATPSIKGAERVLV